MKQNEPINIQEVTKAMERDENLKEEPKEFGKAIKAGLKIIEADPNFRGWFNPNGE